jgi:2-amino-4-hydroxy-6-hydroxymethyldihydropteridine diphosphokinase
MDQVCLIALGSNQPSPAGDPAATLTSALACLKATEGLHLRAVSRFFRTPAFPAGAGPDYINAAAALVSPLPPEAVLTRLHTIEADHERRREIRWGARSLDLDLLACGTTILPDPATWQHWCDISTTLQQTEAPSQLVLPHPRMHERAFVLVPLAEIAPDWCHPVLALSVSLMLARLPRAEVAAATPI